MRTRYAIIPAVMAAALLSMAANTGEQPSKPAAKNKPAAKTAMVERGRYLVTVAGCNDCHTPMRVTPLGPLADFDRSLSGHPQDASDPEGKLGETDIALTGTDLTVWRQPFGVVYARNLTPHKTGLGEWTEAQFIKTIRRGRHQGDGRALLPPMPWYNYASMSNDDLKAVWAYLRSIKPIDNTVPDPKVPPQVVSQFEKVNEALLANVKETPRPMKVTERR